MKIFYAYIAFAVVGISNNCYALPRGHHTSPSSHQKKTICVSNQETPLVSDGELERALLHAAIPLRDEKDDKLFAYFIAILRDFIKILLYRHNEKEVIAHVGSMVDNIVHAAHTLTSKRSVAQNKQKTSVLEKLSRVLILYLYHQNKILQQKYHPKPQPT